MKVEHHRPQFTTQSVRGTADSTSAPAAQPAATSAAPDTLQLSPDVKLAQAAMSGVGDPSSVRPDAVNRAKALLASGQLGSDLERLADKIIDTILES